MDSGPQAVEVVAAVIERADMILIGQRKPRGRPGLKWEFPGGKVEPDEELRGALARELREELGIEAQIGEETERHDFTYSTGATIRLVFFRVTQFAAEPENLDFSAIEWVPRDKLPQHDFLAGDCEFVRHLAKNPPKG